VQRELQDSETEQRALEPHRRQWDADLVEELLLRHGGDFLRGPALDHLHEHRGRRLADRAAAAAELDVLDLVSVEADEDRDLVAAERVEALGLRVGVLDHPVPARVLVVVEDDLAIEAFELVAHENTLRAFSIPTTSRSISSGTV
jgi:hypothetical protein